MKSIQFLTTISLALAACAATLRAEVVPILDDTVAYGVAPTSVITNYGGTARTLAISATRSAYIRFDVASTGILPSEVSSARLTIYFADVTKPGDVYFQEILTAFTERFPETSRPAPDIAGVFANLRAVKGEYVTVDVTPYVRGWLANPATGFGVAIRSNGASAVIASKEGAGSGHPAFLEIDLNTSSTIIDTTESITIRSTPVAQPGLDFLYDNGLGGGSTFGLANTSTGSFAINRNGAPVFTIDSNNTKFGMGSSGSPGTLEVFGDNAAAVISTIYADGGPDNPALIVGQRARGTKATPAAVLAGDELANFNARGYDGGSFSGSRAKLVMSASENWANVANGTEISFQTTPNGTAQRLERMRIANNGNVGIGTTTPGSNLTVSSPGATKIAAVAYQQAAVFAGVKARGTPDTASAVQNGDGLALFGATGYTGTQFPITHAGAMQISATENWTDTAQGAEIYFGTTSNGTTQRVQRMVIAADGSVGIGTLQPAFKLDVNGGIRCVGAVNTSSDARYKTDIRPVAGALETIGALRGVSYEWNRAGFLNKAFPQGRSLGFIAQEVEKALPEVVTRDAEGFYSIAYSEVVPVLVEATKELRAENAALREKLATLEARDQAREARLGRLEAALDDRPARVALEVK